MSVAHDPCASGPRRDVCRLLGIRPDQDFEQLADLALLSERVTHGTLRQDLVAIASALPFTEYVTLLDQLGQDPVGGALGDSDGCGDVAQADRKEQANDHLHQPPGSILDLFILSR
jgi:hypothetical protein